jgi:putative ABC transport system permease protein
MSVAPATRALARLAWRELRRRPGRSVLVIALVALPVAALTVAAVLNASSVAGPEDQRRSVLGGADLVVKFSSQADANSDAIADDLRRLPEGSRVLRVRDRGAVVPGRDGDVLVQVGDLPQAHPLTAGMTKLLRGRVPVGRGEVSASPDALRDLGLRLGDTLSSRHLGVRARITAEVIDPNDIDSAQILTGAPLPHTTDPSSNTRLLVSLPPGADASAIERLRGPGREVRTAADCCPGDRAQAREVTLTMSGLALLIVALVVAAAFAVGARRQLRVIGLLSAAAGADERHVRRLAVLQGTLCGGVGVIAGFALGFTLVALFIAPNIDDMSGRLTGGVTVAPIDFALIAAMAIAATAAGAWLPGRTAARIPILAALGGRAPLRPVPATLPVRGLAMSALGTALLAAGLNGDGPRGLATAGAVLIVLGFVLCAPALVAVLDRLATRARGTTRLAARDIARQRARTGPLVAAILAVASLAVLGSALIRAEQAGRASFFGIGPDQVLLSTSHADFPQRRPNAIVPAELRKRIRALLPRAAEAEIGFDERGAADKWSVGPVVRRPRGDQQLSFGVAIGGPQLLEFLGAASGRAAFDRGDVVALQPGLVEDGHVTVVIPRAGGRTREVRVAASEARAARPIGPVVALMVSAQGADRLGLAATATDVVLRTPNALTAAQKDALQAQAIAFDRAAGPQADAAILVDDNAPRQGSPSELHTWLLAVAAALTLAVVASGLALSAAEGRADDTMLVALGADPATRRRLRATQAGMLVGIGGLLALPAGLIPAAVFVRQFYELRFAVPWTAVAIVLVALPAAAAAGAWLLTRPARWSAPGTWAD